MRHAATLLAVLVLATATTAAAPAPINSDTRVFLPNATVDLRLGDQLEMAATFQNPLATTDQFEVTLKTEPDGTVVARQIQQGSPVSGAEDRFTLDMDPASNQTVRLSLLAVSCLGSGCEVTLTVSGRSAATNERFSTEIPVTVVRSRDIYGGPGIQLLQLLAIAGIGALLAARF